MAGAPHAVGDAAPEPQELETPTEHRNAGELPTRIRAADRPARRTVRLPSAHGVQQAHPQDWREGRRCHPARRVPSLWEHPKSVRAPSRFDSGADETSDSVPGRGPRRIREAREISRPHLRLSGIEARGVKVTADPEEKDATPTRPADDIAAPKRRGRAKKPAKAPKAAKTPKAREKREEAPSLAAGQGHVDSLDGEVVKTVELPGVFRSDIRVDLIRRAVTAFQANRRQPYGPGHQSGLRHSVRWSGKGHGVSRVPRIRGTMIGAQAPGTAGGRRAHPPRPDTVWTKKVNEHERRLARNAALAALKDPRMVASRGHPFPEDITLPVVIEDGIETLTPDSGATREGLKILDQLGLIPDVERAKDGRHIRAGRGKMRGRRYRQPRSVLVVVKEARTVRRLLGNLPGVEVISPAGVNAEVLAPGGDPGRLTVFSEGALEVLRSWPP